MTPDDPATATPRELIARARDIQDAAHVPYSEYRVGAALETVDGSIFVGCNLENANYSNSLHAEEVAIAEAVKEGHREFVRIAVSSDRRDGVTPCGMCRQTLAEFCEDDLVVLCDEGQPEGVTDENVPEGGTDENVPKGGAQDGDAAAIAEYTLGELLPNAITEEMLE